MNPNYNRITYGSAGYPRGYSPDSSLLQSLRTSSIPCLGGRLFRSPNQHDQPLICYALESSNKDLVNELSKTYHAFTRLPAACFVPYETSREVRTGLYVFKFALSKGMRSMRQIMESPEHEQLGDGLFQKLVELLFDYKEAAAQDAEGNGNPAGSYAALCSISLDTVFMDQRGKLRLLPLQCQNGDYPRGFPLEAGTPEADELTDIYTAALLALQVVSGCEYESRSQHKRMCPERVPEWMMKCLCIFPSGRLNLAQCRNLIAQDAAEAAREQSGSTTGRRSNQSAARDALGNRIPANKAPKPAPAPIPKADPEPSAAEPVPPENGSIFSRLHSLRHFWAVPEEQTSKTADFPRPSAPPGSHQRTVLADLGELDSGLFHANPFSRRTTPDESTAPYTGSPRRDPFIRNNEDLIPLVPDDDED